MEDKINELIGQYKYNLEATRQYKKYCHEDIDKQIANETINQITQFIRDLGEIIK